MHSTLTSVAAIIADYLFDGFSGSVFVVIDLRAMISRTYFYSLFLLLSVICARTMSIGLMPQFLHTGGHMGGCLDATVSLL